MNDDIIDSGRAFFASGVTEQASGKRAIVQLYNPPNSGRSGYVDYLGTSNPNPEPRGSAGDLRFGMYPIGEKYCNGFNKILGSNTSMLEIRTGLIPAETMPQHIGMPMELWGGIQRSKTDYPVEGAFRIDPGWGLSVCGWMDNEQTIGTFQWREKDNSLPPPTGERAISEGSPVGSLSPLSNLLDSNILTSAVAADSPSFTVGRVGYGQPKKLTRLLLKSIPNRTLNGRGEAGSYGWTVYGTNDGGTTLSQIQSGTIAYSGAATCEDINLPVSNLSNAYSGHIVKVTDSVGPAGWRVASMDLFETV